MLFNCSAMFDSLWPYVLQHSSLPCPSLSSGVCSNSRPMSWWCHPTISSSLAPFSSCPQSFQASGSFLMSQLFTSGGQGIRASASLSVLPMNIQDWFDLLAVQGTLKSLLQHHSSKASIIGHSAFFYGPTLTSIHYNWKNHSFDCVTLCMYIHPSKYKYIYI